MGEQLQPHVTNACQRMEAIINGEQPDQVPFFPLHISGFAAQNVGYSLASMYKEPEKSFCAQVWTIEQYDYECIPMYNYACYGAWEFGGELKFPTSQYDQAPTIIRYPVETEEDIERLEHYGLPAVTVRGSVPLNIEFSKLQEQNGLPVQFICGTPFTRAANVCGIERLFRWLIKKPELARRLIRLVTDHLVEVAQYWVDTFGAEHIIPYSGNPTEANQMISPKQFEEFCLPYSKEVHEKVLAMGIKRFVFHICGEQNLNLTYLAQIPMGDPGIISIGHEVDLSEAIAYLGEKNIIVGNVEPAMIQTGTPQQVYEMSRQCIEKGKRAPRGYMLSSGCMLPPYAPPYNVYMMKKALEDFGRYE